MLKIAIVGMGKWGKNLLREFSSLSEVVLCCTAGNKENVEWLKSIGLPIVHTDNYNDVLSSEVDAVVIASPISTHFELTHKALQAGKHVFVEKPLATTIEEAKDLVRLSESKNLTLFVGHIFMYNEIFERLKELTKDDPINYAFFDWSKFGSFKEDIFWNLISHDVALCLDFFGMPEDVAILDAKSIVSDCDIVFLQMKFDDGRSCSVAVNRASPTKSKSITLVTDKSTYVWHQNILWGLDRNSKSFRIIHETQSNALKREVEAFLRAIENGIPFITDGEFGKDVVGIISKVLKNTNKLDKNGNFNVIF